MEYTGGQIVVEDYSAGFQYQSGRTLPMELSLWGGFFAGVFPGGAARLAGQRLGVIIAQQKRPPTPAQHKGGARLADARDQLGQRKPGFHIAAHRVEDDEQPFDLGVLLDIHQLRDDVFILGRFLVVRRQRVAFDGTDHSQAVDGMAAFGTDHRTGVHHIFVLQFLLLHLRVPMGRLPVRKVFARLQACLFIEAT